MYSLTAVAGPKVGSLRLPADSSHALSYRASPRTGSLYNTHVENDSNGRELNDYVASENITTAERL